MFDRNYARHYDLLNRSKPYKKELDFVYKWGEKPKTILDIGAGTAQYWRYFPEEVKLKGLERSKAMIEKSNYKEKITRGDILNFSFEGERKVDVVTALFDVVNYLSTLGWIRRLPLNKGGLLVFDIWDYEKVRRDGFRITTRMSRGVRRTIYPIYLWDRVNLAIKVEDNGQAYVENHTLYLHSERDIRKACGNDFRIIDKCPTRTWQAWYKLKKI